MRIQKEIDNVERIKNRVATAPLTMEDAVEFHKQVVDRIEKDRKDINKELGIGDVEEDGFTGASKEPKKVSTPELKKMKLSESLFESTLNESFIKNEKQLAKYIANNFEEITGLNVKDIYNTESDEEIFNQDYVDITYPKIKQFIYDFNEDNDTNFDEEDILYLLDDELSSYRQFNESLNNSNVFAAVEENVGSNYDYNSDTNDFYLFNCTKDTAYDTKNRIAEITSFRYGNPEVIYKLPFEKDVDDDWDDEYDESLNECDKFKKGDCKNYALDEAKISRQNQRRKKDAYLQRKEAEREKAEKEARERERIGDAAWGEKDWIAEREKGDLDFSNYSDEEKAEIEKRLKAFDDNKTAQAQYQRRKEAEEAKRAEEERKKAEQEKEERTKKRIERIGKLANAPKDIGNAFKKGLGIS